MQAARFLDEFEADSSLEPDEAWDESVVALLNYPEVIRMMDEEIDWTWRLGEAVIAQQADVIAAVESFRDRAYAAGNLESDERQTVSNEDRRHQNRSCRRRDHLRSLLRARGSRRLSAASSRVLLLSERLSGLLLPVSGWL